MDDGEGVRLAAYSDLEYFKREGRILTDESFLVFMTELRGACRLGKNEARLVGEGSFDALPQVEVRVLHPRPDEAVDASGGHPTFERCERR